MHTKFLLGSLNGRDHSVLTGTDGITSKWILEKQDGKVWPGFI